MLVDQKILKRVDSLEKLAIIFLQEATDLKAHLTANEVGSRKGNPLPKEIEDKILCRRKRIMLNQKKAV